MDHSPATILSRATWLALMLFVALFTTAVAAQLQRPIPDDSKRGVIRYMEGMVVAIDGKPARLAPGANIRSRENLIIVPSALPSEGALAEYTTDLGGQVFRVWLLTPEEAARPKKKPAAQ